MWMWSSNIHFLDCTVILTSKTLLPFMTFIFTHPNYTMAYYKFKSNYYLTVFLCGRSRWLDELISTVTEDEDDNDITSILSVYCHLLIEKHMGKRHKNRRKKITPCFANVSSSTVFFFFFFYRRIHCDRRRSGKRHQRVDDRTLSHA